MFRKKGYVPPSHAIYPYTTDITTKYHVLRKLLQRKIQIDKIFFRILKRGVRL